LGVAARGPKGLNGGRKIKEGRGIAMRKKGDKRGAL